MNHQEHQEHQVLGGAGACRALYRRPATGTAFEILSACFAAIFIPLVHLVFLVVQKKTHAITPPNELKENPMKSIRTPGLIDFPTNEVKDFFSPSLRAKRGNPAYPQAGLPRRFAPRNDVERTKRCTISKYLRRQLFAVKTLP